jgi:hypothetical protein
MAKTYRAERLKRYPRDKNVYHDHDNCPELNPLHDTANQSHSEGAWFESSNCHSPEPNRLPAQQHPSQRPTTV